MTIRLSRRSLLAGSAGGFAAAAMSPSLSWSFEKRNGRNILVFSGTSGARRLDPHIGYDSTSRLIQQVLYDGLLKYVGNPARIEPWLAESYDVSADGLVYTFKLQSGATFHNGDPVDAEAVRYSFARGLRMNAGIAWMFKAVLKPENIKAVDDLTVAMTLDKPFAPFISYVPWWFIVNPNQVEANVVDGDFGKAWMAENEAGSGPYTLKRYDPTAIVQVDAVRDYWKGWPMGEENRLEAIVLRVIRENGARKSAIQSGEVDTTAWLTPEDFAQIAKNDKIRIENHPGSSTFGIKFNCQNGPTADIDLRKTIAYAFDYDSILQITNGQARLLESVFPDSMVGFQKIDMPRQDLVKAREYLAISQYASGGFELEYVYPSGVDDSRRIGLVLLDNLREFNIGVNVSAQPWATVVDRAKKPETAPAMAAHTVTPISTDPDTVAYQYHRDSWGRYFGTSHYENPAVWDKIVEARFSTDNEVRAKLYAQIQQEIVDDQPEIFCMVANRVWGMREPVKGFEFCPVRFAGEVDLYPMWIDA